MNGNLLFADHADKIVIIGKNPITANAAIKLIHICDPTRATGINATDTAAAPTKITAQPRISVYLL